MCSAAEQCQIYDLIELEADYNVADGCNYERLNITFGCMYDSLIKLTRYGSDSYSSRDDASSISEMTTGRFICGIVFFLITGLTFCICAYRNKWGRTLFTYPQPATGGTYPPPATGGSYPQPVTGGTYSQPATGGTYPPPATGVTYPPSATGGTYPPPATGVTYPPPATGGTYPPPATGGTYPQPATVGISSPYDHSAIGEANLPPPSYGEVTTSGGWFAKTSSSVNKNNQ